MQEKKGKYGAKVHWLLLLTLSIFVQETGNLKVLYKVNQVDSL